MLVRSDAGVGARCPPRHLPAADGRLSIALDLACLAGRAGPALLAGGGHCGGLLLVALHDA